MAEAWLFFMILVLVSWSLSPVVVTLVPKNVNPSTSYRWFPSIMMGRSLQCSSSELGSSLC